MLCRLPGRRGKERTVASYKSRRKRYDACNNMPRSGRGPRESLQSKVSWGSEELQNERAMLSTKNAASDMALAITCREAAGAPAEVCKAKFRGEKEE